MIPTIGRTVFYRLSEQDAAEINRRRTTGQSIAARMRVVTDFGKDGAEITAWPAGAQAHIGNAVEAGHVFPMVIVKTWGSTEDSAVNGQVFLDGNDTFWATSRMRGDQDGHWQWPPLQK
jgi:hypothetical protein